MLVILLAIAAAIFSGCEAAETLSIDEQLSIQTRGEPACSFGKTKSADGIRRMAVIVGVTKYPNLRNKDLPGATQDAKRFFDLLTRKSGFSFPEENVCLLQDEDATSANFVHAFNAQLIANAENKDIAVVYFAGHGGQRKDIGSDCPFSNG